LAQAVADAKSVPTRAGGDPHSSNSFDNSEFADTRFILRIDQIDPVIVNGNIVESYIRKRDFKQENTIGIKHVEFIADG
jgi:hypothetical protein